MSNDSDESTISELQSLAKRQPLRSNDQLNRAKELMITLREKGYTNSNINKLASEENARIFFEIKIYEKLDMKIYETVIFHSSNHIHHCKLLFP
jgi:hypothetical protein